MKKIALALVAFFVLAVAVVFAADEEEGPPCQCLKTIWRDPLKMMQWDKSSPRIEFGGKIDVAPDFTSATPKNPLMYRGWSATGKMLFKFTVDPSKIEWQGKGTNTPNFHFDAKPKGDGTIYFDTTPHGGGVYVAIKGQDSRAKRLDSLVPVMMPDPKNPKMIVPFFPLITALTIAGEDHCVVAWVSKTQSPVGYVEEFTEPFTPEELARKK